MSKELKKQASTLAVEADWKKLRLTALHEQVLALDEGIWTTYLHGLKRLASGLGVEREMANSLAEYIPELHFDDMNREGGWKLNIGFANTLWHAIAEREQQHDEHAD